MKSIAIEIVVGALTVALGMYAYYWFASRKTA